jgi:alcohol dehydrogenase (NADP+)
MDRLELNYLDLYLIHTPFAFQPGDEQDPRDKDDNVIYDRDVTLLDTWTAMESLVDSGKCRAIGVCDISLEKLLPLYEAARIKPAVVQVEAHPYLPETQLLEFCKQKDIVLLAWAIQRGTALLTTSTNAARTRENFAASPIPDDAIEEINRIQTRQRFNEVVKTGSPGFIPQGS